MEELVKNNLDFEVLTDTGWNKFDGVLYKGIRKTVELKLTNDTIVVTPDHGIFTANYEKKVAKKLKPNEKILTSKGIQRVVSVKILEENQVFDLLNVESNRRFYANNILCSNCEFIIDEETLINSTKLAALESMEPLYRTGQVRWFKRPSKGHIYTVSLDPSLGTGGDAAAIQIFEADTTTQIAEWKHNRTPIPEQIKLLAEINKAIYEDTKEPNNLYYSLENNTIGEAALISLAEYGEENIRGTMLSEPRQMGNVRRYRRGFNTTNKTKLAACSKFKNLLESNKLKIFSAGLISELKTFIASGGSYAAKLGENDDLVMASLLSIRMIQHLQNYNVNLDTHVRDHDEIIEPLPFIMSLS